MSVTMASFGLSLPAGAQGAPLSSIVSQTPVSWTPNVSGGPTVGDESFCSTTFFGAAPLDCQSEVYDTAYVNGEVVAVGAFTEVCQPGPNKDNLCTPGTQVTRDDIFAYSAGTGTIDPNFTPVLNEGPAYAVAAGPSGSNTVYVGGAFTTVGGASYKGIVELNVNPGVTTGSTKDGSIVTTFKGSVNTSVKDLILSPDGSALYVGGQFTSVDSVSKFTNGTAVGGLARLNSATGALDESFAFGLGGVITGSPLKVWAMALSTDGTHLALSGAFLDVNGISHPRLAIVDTGGTDGSYGSPATLSTWFAPILANNCTDQHDYVRGLAFSPDGTFVVSADTGLFSDGSTPFSACDAVARFDVNAANTKSTGAPVDVAPSWINYSGGDSFYSVAVSSDGVVYAGGHDRWVNNYCGSNDVCDPNAVLVDGLSALDANTGVGLAWWHPQTLRGLGTIYLSTFPTGTYDGSNAGLALGTDVDEVGGFYHSENALFPALTTSSDAGGPIPSGMFNEEGGTTVTESSTDPLCIDDGGNSTTTGSPVVLSTCANDAEQNWTVEPGVTTTSGGAIEINGLCLDTAGSVTTIGAALSLNTCTVSSNNPTQMWTQVGGNELVNVGATAADGKQTCVDDPGSKTTSGTALSIDACDGDSSQTWPLPAAPAPPTTAPTGLIYPQEEQAKTFNVPCLDDSGNSVAPANKVQLWSCQGNTEQNWTVEPGVTTGTAGGTIEIDDSGSTSYCLDTSSSTTKGTVTAVLNPCDGNASQDWTAGAGYELQNVGASTLNGKSYCLDDPGKATVNGTQPNIIACDAGVFYQAWRLPAD